MESKSKTTARSVFSKREQEVLKLGAAGATDGEISERLSVSVPTLRTYWLRIREKVGGVNRTHAIALAVAGPLAEDAEADPQRRILKRARSETVAQWAWRPADRQVLMDADSRALFGISADSVALPIDRVLDGLWIHDRSRFERFLAQSTDLGPLTPIDLRISGGSGTYQVIRTVNLSVHRSRQGSVTVLFASALSRSAT